MHRLHVNAGVCSLSEPYWFEQLCQTRHLLTDNLTRRLLEAALPTDLSLMNRCFMRGRATKFSINPKAAGHWVLDAAVDAFPAAKHIYMYRCVSAANKFTFPGLSPRLLVVPGVCLSYQS
jgi:hypothetical protein